MVILQKPRLLSLFFPKMLLFLLRDFFVGREKFVYLSKIFFCYCTRLCQKNYKFPVLIFNRTSFSDPEIYLLCFVGSKICTSKCMKISKTIRQESSKDYVLYKIIKQAAVVNRWLLQCQIKKCFKLTNTLFQSSIVMWKSWWMISIQLTIEY